MLPVDRGIVAAISMAGFALALYLLTGATWHYPDAVYFADLLLDGELLHPKHLLHGVLGAGWLRVAGDEATPPIAVLSSLNAMAGAVVAGLVTATLTRRCSTRVAAAAAWVLVGSYGIWSVSVTWEAHTLPLVGLTSALLLMSRARGDAPLLEGATTGCLVATSVLFHQIAVLTVPGFIAGLALVGGRAIRRLLSFGFVLVLVAGGGYAVAANAQSSGGVAVHEYVVGGLTAAEQDKRRGAEAWRSGSRVLVIGQSRRCAGMILSTGEPPSGREDPVGDRVVLVAYGCAALLVVAGLVGLRRRPVPPEAAAGGLWALVGGAAAVLFEPGNYEYYIGPMVGLTVTVSIGLAALARERRRRGQALTVVALLVGSLSYTWNVKTDLLPASTGDQHRSCVDSPAPHRSLRAPGPR